MSSIKTLAFAPTVAAIFEPTILLALALMAVIVMMVLPVPAWLLDIGLAASFGLAILIFTVTLFIERPLDFSAFPTVLLASLMLRLSLNVSSTKLIISEGHTGTHAAGGVIEGFATFIMGGSVVLGLVVFCVLLIVNFVVITKGATRMAEVGARFALDGMPGKQLAIDSDMSAGAIDHREAKELRAREQAETTFFGSLDGASKFVKGDAIAGFLITLLNLIVGLAIGVTLHQMPLAEAFETYSILTVGDGLVSQIPAVVISIAAGLLLARGGATGKADQALMSQFGRHPTALATVAILMGLFAFVPGLPFVPFMAGAVAIGAAAYWVIPRQDPETTDSESAEGSDPLPPSQSLGDIVDLDDLHIAFAPDLVPMVLLDGDGLSGRIDSLRSHVAREFGLILPEIRLTDDATLNPSEYLIRIQGVEFGRGALFPDRVLALIPEDVSLLPHGVDTNEPVYGAPARWLSSEKRDVAVAAGVTVVEPIEVLSTHILEVVKDNLPRLLSLRTLRRHLDEMTNLADPARNEANRRLLEELMPERVSTEVLLAVLRLLLEERVSVRNLPLILETIAEVRPSCTSVDEIAEMVRQRLSFQLIAGLRDDDGNVPLLQLASDWETIFSDYTIRDDTGRGDVALPPEAFQRLVSNASEKISAAAERDLSPAVVTSRLRRKFVRTVLKSKGISAPVLSFEELGAEPKLSLLGVIAA